MATTSSPRTKKKPVQKKSAVRVGGGSKQKAAPWHSRWQTFVFVLVFAVVGSIILALTHAGTAANCISLSSSGNSLQLCSNVLGNGTSLNAQAQYMGASNKDALSSGTVSLYQCDANTLACTVIASASNIRRPNAFVAKNANITTPTTAFAPGTVYEVCVSFANKTGWQATNTCTKLFKYNSADPGSAVVYVKPAPAPAPSPSPSTTPTPKTTPPPTTSAPTCNGADIAKSSGEKWICSFDEEFNGTQLNRALWLPQTTAGSGFATDDTKDGNARACFMDDPNNISVADGYLSLTAREETAPFNCKSTNSAKDFTTTYTAGEITTYNKFSQQFGRFEISAKIPAVKAKGLQETLWLWPNDSVKYGSWPGSGEIDMAEFYSTYSNYNIPYIHYNYSSYDTNTNTNIVTLLAPSYNKNYANCAINFGAFNTYTAVWQPGYIELDVNDKPCVVDNYVSSTGSSPTPFDQPFFLALTQNLGIWPVDRTGKHQSASADNAFVPGTTPLPATTQVDYVRVWK